MDALIKAAAQLFQQHGVDGFRIDAIKHLNWGWQYSLANSIYTFGDSFLLASGFRMVLPIRSIAIRTSTPTRAASRCWIFL